MPIQPRAGPSSSSSSSTTSTTGPKQSNPPLQPMQPVRATSSSSVVQQPTRITPTSSTLQSHSSGSSGSAGALSLAPRTTEAIPFVQPCSVSVERLAIHPRVLALRDTAAPVRPSVSSTSAATPSGTAGTGGREVLRVQQTGMDVDMEVDDEAELEQRRRSRIHSEIASTTSSPLLPIASDRFAKLIFFLFLYCYFLPSLLFFHNKGLFVVKDKSHLSRPSFIFSYKFSSRFLKLIEIRIFLSLIQIFCLKISCLP